MQMPFKQCELIYFCERIFLFTRFQILILLSSLVVMSKLVTCTIGGHLYHPLLWNFLYHPFLSFFITYRMGIDLFVNWQLLQSMTKLISECISTVHFWNLSNFVLQTLLNLLITRFTYHCLNLHYFPIFLLWVESWFNDNHFVLWRLSWKKYPA